MINNILHKGRILLSKFRHVTTGKKRSSQWRKVEKKFLDDNCFCEACGSHNNLQVHHIEPFHLYPELELDPNNLITLCMDTHECHFRLAHGGNFRKFCPEIKEYARQLKNKEKTFEEMYQIAKLAAKSK